jgi:integrase
MDGRLAMKQQQGEYITTSRFGLVYVDFLKEWLNKPIRDITRDMVQAKYKKICSDTGTAAANKTMRVFRAVYNFAGEQAEDDIPANPVRLKGFWRDVGKRRKTIIKDADLPKWYEAVNGSDNPIVTDCLQLLLYTGLRVKEEALKMEWRDVNMDARTFTITEEKAKGKRENTRYMSRQVYTIFKRRFDNQENGFVFPGASGKSHLGYPARQIGAITEKTGIEFCPHDLRRTFATIANDTVPQSQLKYLLGHSTKGGDVTAGYIILSAEKKMEAEQRMADAIDRLLMPPAEGNVIPIGTKKARKGGGA